MVVIVGLGELSVCDWVVAVNDWVVVVGGLGCCQCVRWLSVCKVAVSVWLGDCHCFVCLISFFRSHQQSFS